MEESFDVVGIGYAGVDHLCEVGAFPRPGEKIQMRRFLQQGGGQIGTAMVGLSRWGLRVTAVVAVGDDELGGIALRGLEEEGVDVGGAVVLDCERIRPFTGELLGLCDAVLCDSRFPGEFTRLEGEQAQLAALAGHGMDVLGMTLGEGGSVLKRGDRLIHRPAFAVDAVDSTGAGDVFHAGFTYAWLEGSPLEACLDFGNAAAALKCTALGGRTAIPRDPAAIWELVRRGERR